MLTFTEARIVARREHRLRASSSRCRGSATGTACLFLIGIKLGIPVWTRSLNGECTSVQFDLESPEVVKIDNCR